MADLTLSDWTAIAQIVLAVFTIVGVIASLYFSTKALREVQRDRIERQRPHLAFEGGGMRLHVKFVKAGKAIPGINPRYVARAFPDMPANAESVRIEHFYGQLKNFGLGPALESRVTWVPSRITIGTETFEIDEKKRKEPRYDEKLNEMPTHPQHIAPGVVAQLNRLPTFVEKDFEKKISAVEGFLKIECEDVLGHTQVTRQKFLLYTDYQNNQPWVHFTFTELLLEDEDKSNT